MIIIEIEQYVKNLWSLFFLYPQALIKSYWMDVGDDADRTCKSTWFKFNKLSINFDKTMWYSVIERTVDVLNTWWWNVYSDLSHISVNHTEDKTKCKFCVCVFGLFSKSEHHVEANTFPQSNALSSSLTGRPAEIKEIREKKSSWNQPMFRIQPG